MNCESGSLHDGGYGGFGDFHLHVVGYLEDKAIILDACDGAVKSSYRNDLSSRLHFLNHLVVLLLLFALRRDEKKPHGSKDKDERQHAR